MVCILVPTGTFLPTEVTSEGMVQAGCTSTSTVQDSLEVQETSSPLLVVIEIGAQGSVPIVPEADLGSLENQVSV